MVLVAFLENIKAGDYLQCKEYAEHFPSSMIHIFLPLLLVLGCKSLLTRYTYKYCRIYLYIDKILYLSVAKGVRNIKTITIRNIQSLFIKLH